MHVVLDFNFGQFLSPLDQFVESLVVAQFQNYVDELAVFEAVFEFHHIRGLDLRVDLDLGRKLNYAKGTFYLAFDLVKVVLSMIFTADLRFVFRLITSWQTANPPCVYI